MDVEAIRHELAAGMRATPNPAYALTTPPESRTWGNSDPAMLSSMPEGSPLRNIETPARRTTPVPPSQEPSGFSNPLLGTPRCGAHAYAGVSGILHSGGPSAFSGGLGVTHMLHAHNEGMHSAASYSSAPFGAAAHAGLPAQVRHALAAPGRLHKQSLQNTERTTCASASDCMP